MILIPRITLATPADCRGIAEMSREHIEYGLGWSWTAARVLGAIRDESTNVAVMNDRGALVGFGIMQYGQEKAHLALLCVAPSHRQRGRGAALIEWLEKCAMTAGVARIQLEARADNPAALAFYAQQGYERIGTAVRYYRGTLDAVRFEKRWRSGG